MAHWYVSHWKLIASLGAPLIVAVIAAIKHWQATSTFFAKNWMLIAALGVPIVFIFDEAIEHCTDISQWITINSKLVAPLLTPSVTLIAISITAVLTYLGWRVAREKDFRLEQERNANAIKFENRKANHKYVSDQIQNLYGPLMALCRTRDAAFGELLRLHRPELKGEPGSYFDETRRSGEQLYQWRLWRKEVFLPLLERMKEIVVNNAHLIDTDGQAIDDEETALPQPFRVLLAHVTTYQALVKHWADVIAKDKEDKTNKIDDQQKIEGMYEPVVPHTADQNFSTEFHAAVEAKFKELKAKQAELMNNI
jgi:hypothetical protein